MSTTKLVATSTPPRPSLPPEKPIIQGSPGERDALIRASRERRLTEAEGMRLAALGWTPDASLEHARLVRDRHPDLFPLLRVNPAVADHYDKSRKRALDAGRDVREPDASTLAALDTAADGLRALLAETPPDLRDINRQGREAFQAAIVSDWPAGVSAWQSWLSAIAELDEHGRRLSRARAAFGLAHGSASAERPKLLEELEAALGGRTSLPGLIPPGPGPETA